MMDFEHDDRPADAEDASRRLRRFQDTGDPRHLWPGLTESARTSAGRELGRVVAAVLAGETPVRLDPQRAHDPYALGVAGHTTGIGPVIGRWLEQGLVVAERDHAAAFARHLRHGRRRALRIDSESLPAIDAMIAADLDPIVLKGFHTSRTLFEEPGARRMADVDLLIRPEHVDQAESILSTYGFVASSPAARPYKREWMSASIDPRLFSVELTDARSRWTFELHASLDRSFGAGSVARLDVLRDRTEEIDVCGRSMRALRPAPLVVFLACHCSHELDGVRLLRLYELGLATGPVAGAARVDWTEVLDLLRETRTARFAFPAFELLNVLAPGSVDGRVLALGRHESTVAARHTVARLIPAGGSLDDRSVVRQLMWTRSPVGVAQRLWRAAWPASGWKTRLRRLRRGTVSLLAPDERRA